jgi:hypothetical protein
MATAGPRFRAVYGCNLVAELKHLPRRAAVQHCQRSSHHGPLGRRRPHEIERAYQDRAL